MANSLQSEWDAAAPSSNSEWDNANTVSPDEWNNAVKAVPVKAEKSFLGGVGDALSTRLSNIGKTWTDTQSKYDPGQQESPTESFVKSPGRLFRTAGQAAGGVNDIIGEGAKSLYNAWMPEGAKQAISSGVDSVLKSGPVSSGIQSLQSVYEGAKKSYPNEVGNIEAAGNIAALFPLAKGAGMAMGGVKSAGKAVTGLAGDISSSLAKQSPEAAASMIDTAIESGINKAIRPSVVGKSTAPQVKAYMDNAKSAVKSIVENKSNITLTNADGEVIKGALPKSLNQLSEAIDQTKKGIFTQYDALATKAGAKGVEVDLSQAAKEIRDIADQSVIADFSPNVAEYANKIATNLEKRGAYTATEAQDAVTHLNKTLEAFYKNPSYENARIVGIDAVAANNIRSALDTAIEGATGGAYQELKNSYGALKTIEKDVAHRSIVDARRNIKGLLDFTDIMTSGEFVAGVASMNPAMMAKGAFGRGIKEYIKRINDPNRIVRDMFGAVEKVTNNIDYRRKASSLVGDASGIMPTPKGLPMPERGFTLNGPPTGEPLGRVKPTSDIIDAEFTSSPQKQLPRPYNTESQKLLPAGQGFITIGDHSYKVSNTKMKTLSEARMRMIDAMSPLEQVRTLDNWGIIKK